MRLKEIYERLQIELKLKSRFSDWYRKFEGLNQYEQLNKLNKYLARFGMEIDENTNKIQLTLESKYIINNGCEVTNLAAEKSIYKSEKEIIKALHDGKFKLHKVKLSWYISNLDYSKYLARYINNKFLYCVQVGNYIKLGYSSDIKKRIRELKRHNNGMLVQLLYSKSGTKEMERSLLIKFKSFKAAGEYFWPDMLIDADSRMINSEFKSWNHHNNYDIKQIPLFQRWGQTRQVKTGSWQKGIQYRKVQNRDMNSFYLEYRNYFASLAR